MVRSVWRYTAQALPVGSLSLVPGGTTTGRKSRLCLQILEELAQELPRPIHKTIQSVCQLLGAGPPGSITGALVLAAHLPVMGGIQRGLLLVRLRVLPTGPIDRAESMAVEGYSTTRELWSQETSPIQLLGQ